MTFEKQKGKITIYACGGAGINVAKELHRFTSKPDTGFAEIEIVYVDAAKSNLNPYMSVSNSYLIEELDGSGQVRGQNFEVIEGRIRDVLKSFPAKDAAIVIHSGGGGSGSVAGPALISELNSKGIPAVAIVIGCLDTRKYAENTLNTILTYQGIADDTGIPTVVAYVENNKKTARREVDGRIQEIVIYLAALFSRENDELDSEDLKNWLNFPRVTHYHAQLAALIIGPDLTKAAERVSDLGDVGNYISVASLVHDRDYPSLSIIPDYQCLGIIPSGTDIDITPEKPLRFATTDGFFHDVVVRIKKFIKELDESAAANVAKRSELSSVKPTAKRGFVV